MEIYVETERFTPNDYTISFCLHHFRIFWGKIFSDSEFQLHFETCLISEHILYQIGL